MTFGVTIMFTFLDTGPFRVNQSVYVMVAIVLEENEILCL